jgi:hypothetical protein
MEPIEEKRKCWDGDYSWESRGEEWSRDWGTASMQWYGNILPRIHTFRLGRDDHRDRLCLRSLDGIPEGLLPAPDRCRNEELTDLGKLFQRLLSGD